MPRASTVVRVAARLARAVTALAAAVALLPVALVAVTGMALAWRQGWRPARLYRAAAWCLPMVAVWLAATALASHSVWPAADAPRLAWLAIWRHGDYLAAAVLTAPAAIPIGLLVALGVVAPAGIDGVRRRRPLPRHRGQLRRPPVAASGPRRAGSHRSAGRRPATHRQG